MITGEHQTSLDPVPTSFTGRINFMDALFTATAKYIYIYRHGPVVVHHSSWSVSSSPSVHVPCIDASIPVDKNDTTLSCMSWVAICEATHLLVLLPSKMPNCQ